MRGGTTVKVPYKFGTQIGANKTYQIVLPCALLIQKIQIDLE